MTNCLQRIVIRSISFENAFHLGNKKLLSKHQVNYVEDIIVTRDTSNIGMSRRQVIQIILDIVQAYYYVHADNNLDYIFGKIGCQT